MWQKKYDRSIMLIFFGLVMLKLETVSMQSCTNEEIGLSYLQKYGYTVSEEFISGKVFSAILGSSYLMSLVLTILINTFLFP